METPDLDEKACKRTERIGIHESNRYLTFTHNEQDICTVEDKLGVFKKKTLWMNSNKKKNMAACFCDRAMNMKRAFTALDFGSQQKLSPSHSSEE